MLFFDSKLLSHIVQPKLNRKSRNWRWPSLFFILDLGDLQIEKSVLGQYLPCHTIAGFGPRCCYDLAVEKAHVLSQYELFQEIGSVQESHYPFFLERQCSLYQNYYLDDLEFLWCLRQKKKNHFQPYHHYYLLIFFLFLFDGKKMKNLLLSHLEIERRLAPLSFWGELKEREIMSNT